MGCLGCMQLCPAAKTRVQQILFLQLLIADIIQTGSVTLVPLFPACTAAVIPVDAEPFEIVLDEICQLARAAHRVQVLYAQQISAVFRPNRQPRQHRAQNIAQMNASARRRGKSSANRHVSACPPDDPRSPPCTLRSHACSASGRPHPLLE